MFRTALLRTAARVAPLRVARPAPRAPRFMPRMLGLRMYSAGGSLQKNEVEGRIMSLLQGFDKVSTPSLLCMERLLTKI